MEGLFLLFYCKGGWAKLVYTYKFLETKTVLFQIIMRIIMSIEEEGNFDFFLT